MSKGRTIKLGFENIHLKIHRKIPMNYEKYLENVNHGKYIQFKLKWRLEGCQLCHKDRKDYRKFVLNFYSSLSGRPIM
jgi:hypothetical protein